MLHFPQHSQPRQSIQNICSSLTIIFSTTVNSMLIQFNSNICTRQLMYITLARTAKQTTKVRTPITGYKKGCPQIRDGVTAETLNRHYASISTDNAYEKPCRRMTVYQKQVYITDLQMFNILDHLKHTVTYGDWTGWYSSLVPQARSADICGTAEKIVKSISFIWNCTDSIEAFWHLATSKGSGSNWRR